MNKCVTCHGTMQKTETKCFMCGAEVNLNREKVTLRQRCYSVVKVALIISLVLTVASIFTDYVPSFTKCFVLTVVLGLVKNSAAQMDANQ